MYNCDKYNKEFKYNSKFLEHLNRKTPCNKNKIIKKEYKCNICLKTFRDSYVLKNHKNKKNPCISQIINSNNTMINSNNTNNNIINISINDKMIAENQVGLNSLSLKEIPKILQHENIYKFLKFATLSKNYDNEEILNNIDEIDLLIRIIFCNIQIPENFIFFKDFIKNQVYIKVDNNEIQKLTSAHIIYCIYLVLDELKNDDRLDDDLKKYYLKYIKKYNSGEFTNYDSYKMKEFISNMFDKIKEALSDLFDNLKLFKKQNYKKIENHQNQILDNLKKKYNEKTIEKLKKSKLKHNNTLFEDLEKIYNDYKNECKEVDNIEEFEDNVYMIIYDKPFFNSEKIFFLILSYFIKNFYFSDSLERIKYKNNNFYYFQNDNNDFVELSISDMYSIFVDDIIQELLSQKIMLTEDKIYKDYDIEKSDYDDLLKYIIGEKYKYHRILKYMISNNVNKIEIKPLNNKSLINI